MVIPDLKDKTTLHSVCRYAVAIASLILVRSSVQKIRFISPKFFISFITESKYSVVGGSFQLWTVYPFLFGNFMDILYLYINHYFCTITPNGFATHAKLFALLISYMFLILILLNSPTTPHEYVRLRSFPSSRFTISTQFALRILRYKYWKSSSYPIFSVWGLCNEKT